MAGREIHPEILARLDKNFSSFIVRDVMYSFKERRVTGDYYSLHKLATEIEYRMHNESQGWGNAER